MSEKPFERVPEPKLLVDDAMESFEKEGSGQAPALMGKPPRKNVKKAKTHAPAKRLSIASTAAHTISWGHLSQVNTQYWR